MKWEFTYVIGGEGDTEEEALADALDAFNADQGLPSSSELIEEDGEDEER